MNFFLLLFVYIAILLINTDWDSMPCNVYTCRLRNSSLSAHQDKSWMSIKIWKSRYLSDVKSHLKLVGVGGGNHFWKNLDMFFSTLRQGLTKSYLPLTRSLHRSHLNKGYTHPVTMLQNQKNVQCSIGILCVTFNISIPSSEKWNLLKKSRDSWFGAQWRECLCFNQVRFV